ncbi:MAG: hypothetical protein U1F43_03850 [Myxococcota bacterium]
MQQRRSLGFLCVVPCLAACDDAAPDPSEILPRAECAIAVVASDYGSSSVSLLAADGRPCASDIVHSGSRPPGLLTALSGDVVLPTSAPPAGSPSELVLIDRYPNGVVTLVDPDSTKLAVQSQYAVAPGFVGNPQDMLRLGDGTALVSRLQKNPEPTPEAIDFDDGSDLLIIDLIDGHRVGRIDLTAAAEPGFDPTPGLMAAAGGLVWVGLSHLTTDLVSAIGPGRVAAVDADARELVATVPLAPFTNCGQLAASPSGVWVACSGKFKGRVDAQVEQSGLAWIDAATREVMWSGGAVELGGAPFGLSLAALDDQRALAVSLGDIGVHSPDHLVVIDRRDGSATPLLASTDAFEIGGILPSPEAGVVLVAVADIYAPRIERLSLDRLARLEPITQSSATGLPPRLLSFFRPRAAR